MVNGYAMEACVHHKSSYTDALDKDNKGPEHVGDASVLLSYSWGERYQHVFGALQEWALEEKRDPKKTYVWVCSLCLNRESRD